MSLVVLVGREIEFFFFIAPSCGTFFVFAEVPPDGELKRYVPTRVLVIHKLVDVVYNGLEYPLELSRIFSTGCINPLLSKPIRAIGARALNSLDNRTTRAGRASRSPLYVDNR